MSQRRTDVCVWARSTLSSPSVQHYLATDDEAVDTIRRILRHVVMWAIHDGGSLTANDSHWAAALEYMTLPLPKWRTKLAAKAARGAWTIPLTQSKLIPLNTRTLRPGNWPDGVDSPAASTATDADIDAAIWGW